MKFLLLLSMLCVTLAPATASQVDSLVTKGKIALAGQDLLRADTHFVEALTLAPNHASANFYRAATRLLRLSSEPAVSDLLTRLGLPIAGRNIYNWTAQLPRDNDGQVIGPDVSGPEITGVLRGAILQGVVDAEANLSRISNTNFALFVPHQESGVGGVVVDYGDVQVIRAMLHMVRYLVFTVHSWNTDLVLADLYEQQLVESLSVENVLATYPNLFMFRSTADLAQARTAFTQAATAYFAGSQFIRGRHEQDVHLFNLDAETSIDEAKFRQLLTDLQQSLQGPVVLTAESNLTVHLNLHFTDLIPLRTLLPAFGGNRMIVGSLPDPQFGGLITGLLRGDIEEWLSDKFDSTTKLGRPQVTVPNNLVIQFDTLMDHVYTIETSPNLIDWSEAVTFESTALRFYFSDDSLADASNGFYRLVDVTDQYAIVQGTVIDICNETPIAGASVTLDPGEFEQTSDAQGKFYFLQRKNPDDNQHALTISASGYEVYVHYFYGDRSESRRYLRPLQSSPPANDAFAQAQTLVGLPIDIQATTCGATLEANEPGFHHLYGDSSVWYTWTAPFTGEVRIYAWGLGDEYFSTQLYTGTSLANLTNISDYVFYVEAGTTYRLAVVGSYGRFELEIGSPPRVTLNSPSDYQIVHGNEVLFDFDAFDDDGIIESITIQLDFDEEATITNAPWTHLWTGLKPGYHFAEIEAEDDYGNDTYLYVEFEVRPSHDDFAGATPLSSTAPAVAGSTDGGTPDEDDPDLGRGQGASVWWTWMATSNSPISLIVTPKSSGPTTLGVGIFAGNSLQNLIEVGSNSADEVVGYYGELGLNGQIRSTVAEFNAIAGTLYHILVVDTDRTSDFHLQLVPSFAPTVTIDAPLPDAEFGAGASVDIAVNVQDVDGMVCRVDYLLASSDDPESSAPVIKSIFSSPFGFTLTNLAGGYYTLWAAATDNSGITRLSEPRWFAIGEVPMGPLTEALDDPNLAWTPGGIASWVKINDVSHDNEDAARSPAVPPGGEAWIVTEVNGPGTLTFWWAVESEATYDSLQFLINGIPQAAISGSFGWTFKTYDLGAGQHTLRWRYHKDDSVSIGADAGFLDEVSFVRDSP